MTHLVVHLIDELDICGLVHFRWMYPIEHVQTRREYNKGIFFRMSESSTQSTCKILEQQGVGMFGMLVRKKE